MFSAEQQTGTGRDYGVCGTSHSAMRRPPGCVMLQRDDNSAGVAIAAHPAIAPGTPPAA